MTNYRSLAADRIDLQQAADALLAIVQSPAPRPTAASLSLAYLTKVVREYVAQAEPIVKTAVEAERGGKHHLQAEQSLQALEALSDEWCDYVYRWDQVAITRKWSHFAKATVRMLGSLPERTSAQVAVLYSLAVYHQVLPLGI